MPQLQVFKVLVALPGGACKLPRDSAPTDGPVIHA